MHPGPAHGLAARTILEHVGGGDEQEMLGFLDRGGVGHPAESQEYVLHQIGHIGLHAHAALEETAERLAIGLRQPREDEVPRRTGIRLFALSFRDGPLVYRAVMNRTGSPCLMGHAIERAVERQHVDVGIAEEGR